MNINNKYKRFTFFAKGLILSFVFIILQPICFFFLSIKEYFERKFCVLKDAALEMLLSEKDKAARFLLPVTAQLLESQSTKYAEEYYQYHAENAFDELKLLFLTGTLIEHEDANESSGNSWSISYEHPEAVEIIKEGSEVYFQYSTFEIVKGFVSKTLCSVIVQDPMDESRRGYTGSTDFKRIYIYNEGMQSEEMMFYTLFREVCRYVIFRNSEGWEHVLKVDNILETSEEMNSIPVKSLIKTAYEALKATLKNPADVIEERHLLVIAAIVLNSLAPSRKMYHIFNSIMISEGLSYSWLKENEKEIFNWVYSILGIIGVDLKPSAEGKPHQEGQVGFLVIG